MKKENASIDGFIPRRPGSQIGELHSLKNPEGSVSPIDRELHTGSNASTELLGTPRKGKILTGEELTESLKRIDDEDSKKSKRRRSSGKPERPRRKVGKIILWSSISLVAVVLLIGGYVLLKGVLAGNKIFQGNIFDVITKSEPLQQDAQGRSNFVIFGTAEDDEGGEHGGRNLTDSIMILSVDQTKKNAYMVSLPRDLWVQYEARCTVGDQGRINAVYFCASNDGQNEEAGAKALRAKAGEVLGLDIQYSIHLNFTAVVDAVNAVGGVDVTIQSSDPRGILDRNFDWKCNFSCYLVNYKNGEVAHLDGEHALALARARNAAGGYGLPNGNFDREKNQQMILEALRDKALSSGTLTNLGAVTGLFDALGNNLRTNIQTKEIRTIMELAADIPSESIESLSLNEPDNMLVTTGMYNGQSIVRPVAGILNYSEIQAFIQKSLTSDPFVKEEPHVSVLNGTGTSGIGQTQADNLAAIGFTIDVVGNAPEANYDAVEIYQLSADKPATAAKLKTMFGVELRTTPPPVSVVGETDFLIIIGHASAVR